MGNIKYIIGGAFGVIAIVVVLMFLGVIPGLRGLNTTTVSKADLLMWDIGDDKGAYAALLKSFQQANPGIKVTYVKKTEDTYEQDLLRAFATGKGPDVFSIHHTETIKYGNDLLSPAPAALFPAAQIANDYVDVVQKDFLFNANVFAVPMYVDTLALYYNTDLFNSAGIVFPPATWDDFVKDSRLLTKRKQSGDIIVSGAALGGGKNVVSSSDILAMLMLQNGANLTNETGKINLRMGGGATAAIEKAIEFYTSFAKQASSNYSWSGSAQESSEDMFAQGKAAMMIGYASARDRILKKSPRLRFAVAPLPQEANAIIKKNYADYRGFGVYKNSPSKDAAWQLLQFLSFSENQKYYCSVVQEGASKKSVIAEQQQDPNLKVFADQALSAVTWLQLDRAVIRDGFITMIEAQISGDQSLKQTIENGERNINALMKTL